MNTDQFSFMTTAHKGIIPKMSHPYLTSGEVEENQDSRSAEESAAPGPVYDAPVYNTHVYNTEDSGAAVEEEEEGENLFLSGTPIVNPVSEIMVMYNILRNEPDHIEPEPIEGDEEDEEEEEEEETSENDPDDYEDTDDSYDDYSDSDISLEYQDISTNMEEMFLCIPDDKLTEHMCNAIARFCPWLLDKIPERFCTPRMYMAAIRQYPDAISKVPDHLITEEMCARCIYKKGNTLQYIPDRFITPALCVDAILNDKDAIYFVPDRCFTPAIWERAIKYDPIHYLPLLPRELLSFNMALLAIKNCPAAIEFVPRDMLTPGLCFEAVYRSGPAIRLIPSSLRTFDICFAAAQQFKKANRYIPEKLKHMIAIHIKQLKTEHTEVWVNHILALYQPIDKAETENENGEESENTCCITYERILENGSYMQCDKCHSNYSVMPLYTWLKLNATCPMCRTEWGNQIAYINKDHP